MNATSKSLKPHVWEAYASLPTMDPQLVQFYRQYMQQIQTLTIPSGNLLVLPYVQDQLYKHFFNGPLKGPAAYQRKVLKQVISLIERNISDPEQDVGTTS